MLQKKYIIFRENIPLVEKMEELRNILQDIKKNYEAQEGKSLYLHLVFHGLESKAGLLVRQSIKELLPQAVVTGMTETIFLPKDEACYLVINANIFRCTKVKLLSFDGYPEDYVDLGVQMGKEVAAIPDAKAAAVYCSSMGAEFSMLFRALTEENDDIVFFGASAGVFGNFNDIQSSCTNLFLLDVSNYQEKQFILGEQIYVSGIIVVVFSGEELHVQGDYILGWKPLGKEMTVTEVKGVSCVSRIDDMPATMVYEHYLHVTPDENFVFNIAEFPISVERNGCLIARVPPVHDDEGRIYFNGDIYEGEKIRLTYAVHGEILQETDRISKNMCGFNPEGIILNVCGNRSLFLREAAQEEIKDYQRFAPDLITNYGTSEFYGYHGQGGVLNSALIAVGFREGEGKLLDRCNSFVPQEEEHHYVIPLAARMASFLDAMAQELTDSNEDLKKMAKKAESANKAKSDFLSNMSHEIRTPINAILGMDEMILRECNEPTILEYAEKIRMAGNNLLGLINDILDFSKIEAGKLEIIPVEYATSSLLNDLVNMIAVRAAQKGLDFKVEAAEDLPSMLLGDELRLRQVVTNILTNAVKYTEHGSVTLLMSWDKLSSEEILLKVAVKDTGIGIKEEDISKLFEAFERIEEKRNRTIEGTGLGLNITQLLLSLMGSRLEVESTYGSGSCFHFNVRQKVLNWDTMGNFEESYRRTQAECHREGSSFVAPEARIMVVDDTDMNLTVIKGLLKRTQIHVDTAISGYECLEMAKSTVYDAIFLDHRMPGMDGIETLAELKKLTDSLNTDTPVIALTANAVAGARELYRQAGFDDYMTKPIDTRRLEECLLSFLPAEKVQQEVKGEVEISEEVTLPDWLNNVHGLDTKSGIKHCGSVEAYLSALTVFAESLPGTVMEIKRFWEAKDWANYTTKVHALKSTARVAGFPLLSERARRLEDAGNNGYIDEIISDTPVLLALCQDCAKELAPLTERNKTPEEDKQTISDAELAEAWETLAGIIQSFDYDSLMYMLEELEGYQLPPKEQEKLDALKEAAKIPDWEKLKSCLL